MLGRLFPPASTLKPLLSDRTGMVRAYSRALVLRARIEVLRNHHSIALRNVLRGWRLAGTEAIGSRSIEMADQLTRRLLFSDGRLRPIAENPLLRAYVGSEEARVIRHEFAAYSQDHQVRLKFPRGNDNGERQGDLIVLKEFDPINSERGVLLLNYTEGLRRFAALFDVPAVAGRYALVFEPSWWGYQDITFLMFAGADLDVVVQCPARNDYDFIAGLDMNLVATRLGAGDWADPDLFQAGKTGDRRFDLVMVSSWSPVKRHRELFQAMREMQEHDGVRLRVALIGYPAEWTQSDVAELARKTGVLDSCKFYENVTPETVAKIVGDARAYVLLSRTEGANRALYEAIFCDTPVIVYRHHRGVNTDHIVAETGALYEHGALADAIGDVLANSSRFAPRAWALKNTGFHNSTRELNTVLRGIAIRRQMPWTRDIVGKKNAPNAIYAKAGAFRTFDAEYARLSELLLPQLKQ